MTTPRWGRWSASCSAARCPTGVIILGKVTNDWANGDPNVRTNRHGYAYGVRF